MSGMERARPVIDRLFVEAEEADRYFVKEVAEGRRSMAEVLADTVAGEKTDLGFICSAQSDIFLSVSPSYGRFLYMCARTRRAETIVEFGTSMGLSTLHLAAALRDNGGGRLITTELEPRKVARARRHLEEAGLHTLVDIRQGDARDTLREDVEAVDLVLLDGALTLYLDILKLLEPKLRPGAIILGENAFEEASGYLAYVRDPANGYMSCRLPIDPERGNEFTVFLGAGQSRNPVR